ncbi:tetratricopeptide repeat protein [Iodobacter sp. HSC-16F04]|uniref:Cell division coordinator CpoB n=1 Tax=Iodobacter violaceini TaxID=3044271 RepID=A0ABX0KYF5_9NEIS|nr:YbgF trimerization domain-containing protein [Iodobacter violacea]NHQ87059.1 tetratricopeptide repeat protein [Iodobacter violacea]
MKRIATLLLLAFSVQAHAGLFDDNEARQQLNDLRNAQTQAQKKTDDRLMQLEAGNSRSIELVGQLEKLRQEIATLRGQNEVLQFNLDEAAKRQKDLYTDLDARMRAMEMAKVESKAAAVVSEQQQLDDLVQLTRSGKHKEAVVGLQKFINENSSSAQLPSAYYWMGVSQTALKSYKGAQASYQQVLASNDETRAPDALFGLAIVANSLGDKKSSRKYLLQLIEKYPQAEKAAAAKKALLATD